MAGVVLGFAALTVLLTWPLAAHLGTVGRADNGDGRLSIWNVAWVARTLVVDPLHVFDANIFYPHRWTLAYSENNIGAGVLARSGLLADRKSRIRAQLCRSSFSPWRTALLPGPLSDRRSAGGGDRRICFAFCPYVFAHTPHIQLLMTAGLPFSMLAFHRVADRPTPGRGAVLGLRWRRRRFRAATTACLSCSWSGSPC